MVRTSCPGALEQLDKSGLSFKTLYVQGEGTRVEGVSGEEGATGPSSIRALFLLKGREGPTADEATPRSSAAVVLGWPELSGRWKRLSHDHVSTSLLSHTACVWGAKPEVAQKSRILESIPLLSSSYKDNNKNGKMQESNTRTATRTRVPAAARTH